MFFKILIISLIKSISFGCIYILQPYIHNFNINIFYIDKLNILFISLLLIKFYISYSNYIKIFKLLENIYSSIKYLLNIYTILINYEYVDNDIEDIEELHDNKNSINISINTENNQYNKKIQITYIKDMLILYLSLSLSSVFKLNQEFTPYVDNKRLLEYLNNEVKQINNNNNNSIIIISLIELLILKNFNDLKNLNYINITDCNLLINSFKKLQDLISELYHLNSNNNIYYFIKSFTYVILFINIILIYLQYLNNDIYSFLCTLLVNFIIIFIDDIVNSYLYICDLLSHIFDFETYIKEINEDIFMMHYLYISNKEYIL
jgi:hypothetical protein